MCVRACVRDLCACCGCVVCVRVRMYVYVPRSTGLLIYYLVNWLVNWLIYVGEVGACPHT